MTKFISLIFLVVLILQSCNCQLSYQEELADLTGRNNGPDDSPITVSTFESE